MDCPRCKEKAKLKHITADKIYYWCENCKETIKMVIKMDVFKLYITHLLAQYSYDFDLQANFNIKEIADMDKIINEINKINLKNEGLI